MVDHRHFHRIEPARDRLADAAHADKAHRAVAQRRLGERIALLSPLARAQITFGLRELAHRAEQKPQRRIGDLLVQYIRSVGNGDAMRNGPGGVDVVVADAEGRDHFEVGKALHHLAGKFLGGVGHGDRAYARANLGEKGGAVAGIRQLVQAEGILEPAEDHRLRRSDHQHIAFFAGQASPPRKIDQRQSSIVRRWTQKMQGISVGTSAR